MSESPGLKENNITVSKPDKMSIENTKPYFFINLSFVNIRKTVKTNDAKNRQPKEPVINPCQNTPVA